MRPDGEATSVVRRAGESDFADWQAFVDGSPSAGPMHNIGWYYVLRDCYAVTPIFFIAYDGDAVSGVMPMYRTSSVFTGTHVTTLEGGVLAAAAQPVNALLAAARRLQLERGIRYVQIRGGAPAPDPSATVTTIHTVVSTASGVDRAWANIKPKTRWGIRQAEKQDLTVAQDRALRDLDTFYDLYAEHMRGLGTPVFGRRTLHAMRTHLGSERLRLYIISYRGKAVGGMLCLVQGDQWTDLYAIVRRDQSIEYANYLLYWHVMREAAGLGVRSFDLGRSSPGSNVHLFKRKWGGQDIEVPYAFYTSDSDRTRRLGLVGDVREKGVRQRVWSMLPLRVCNTLGPIIRRDLPFL